MKKIVIISSSIIIIAAIISYLFSDNQKITEDKDYDILEKEGVINIVTNLDPIGYYVFSDTIIGYNHDMLIALQKYTNIRFKISVENSLDKSFEDLKSGKYDIIARNIPINSELKTEYSFTNPIINNKLILVQRKAEFNDSIQPIRNHLDLGKTFIRVPKGSPSILRLQNLSHEIGDTIYIVEDNVYEADQLALMVAAGDIDYTVCDEKTARKLASKIPEIDIETDIGFTHLEGWAVRSNSAVLLDSLNIWIENIKKTKQYSRILKKYYNTFN